MKRARGEGSSGSGRGWLLTVCLQRDYLGQEGASSGVHCGQQEARRVSAGLRMLGQCVQSHAHNNISSNNNTSNDNNKKSHLESDGQHASSSDEHNNNTLLTSSSSLCSGQLRTVHIRDWHDELRDAAHLQRFGVHCVEGSEGAQLLWPPLLHCCQRTVDAHSLNDINDTDLLMALKDLNVNNDRVAVVGCWTDLKVSYLLYDLATRVGVKNLATSSALTASNDVLAHHGALRRLSNLDVTVFGGVFDLLDWLTFGALADTLPLMPATPHVVLQHSNVPLREAELQLVRSVFADCSRVTLTPITDGFSGAKVMRVSSVTNTNLENFPTLIKWGDRKSIIAERINCETVESVLGNNAPRVLAFSDLCSEPLAILKFAFAALLSQDDSGPTVRSFKDLYMKGTAAEAVRVMKILFGGIMSRLFRNATHVPYDLFAAYDFNGRGWSWRAGGTDVPDRVLERIEVLLPGQSRSDHLDFFGVRRVQNRLVEFLNDVPRMRALLKNSHQQVCTVHGDLHGGNVLVDGNFNVFLIDFAYTSEGPIMKDFGKMEADILYCYTPLASVEEFVMATDLSLQLSKITDLGAEVPAISFGNEKFNKPWQAVAEIRKQMTKAVREHRSTLHLTLARMRYALHALTFDYLTPLNRAWALFEASLFAHDLLERNRFHCAEYPIYQIEGRLHVSYLPGRMDRNASLADDLDRLVAEGIALVVVCVTFAQLEWAHGGQTFFQELQRRHIDTLHFPCQSGGIPSFATLEQVVTTMRREMDAGRNVLVVSLAGLGRACLVAGAALKRMHPDWSVALLEETLAIRRQCTRALETDEQRKVLQEF